jgi:HSP20 family protein
MMVKYCSLDDKYSDAADRIQGNNQMTYLTPQTKWFGPALTFEANSAPFSAMRREMDRIFDELSGGSSASATRCAAPRMSVSETDTSVEIEAELPGVDEKDIEVALNDDVLTIKGEKRMEREEQQKDYYHQERTFGRFARSITLPFDPDPKTVKTLFAKGVLKITLPKSAAVKQQTIKIPVKAAA